MPSTLVTFIGAYPFSCDVSCDRGVHTALAEGAQELVDFAFEAGRMDVKTSKFLYNVFWKVENTTVGKCLCD